MEKLIAKLAQVLVQKGRLPKALVLGLISGLIISFETIKNLFIGAAVEGDAPMPTESLGLVIGIFGIGFVCGILAYVLIVWSTNGNWIQHAATGAIIAFTYALLVNTFLIHPSESPAATSAERFVISFVTLIGAGMGVFIPYDARHNVLERPIRWPRRRKED